MKNRPEIDGLRAIAVVPVILDHAKFSVFSGGYVGVDIFFVISGFLISSIIYSEALAGSFSILRFYERRVRRIFPALLVVILASFPAAHFLMLPDPYENFSQSVIATLLFSNNVLLTVTSGYWALASDFKPLLHTWSLGVEEQFYVAYPILVILIFKFWKRAFPAVLVLGVAVSFLASVLLSPSQPNASFYLLHTRAWELLLGAIAAYYMPEQISRRNGSILSAVGLALILIAIFGFNEKIAYPYYYAALPCVGTALILLYSDDKIGVGRLLALKPFVGIGLISYSAYLWHQPLFAFARIRSIQEPSPWLYAFLVVVTLLLAYLTWRYVEQPFRNKTLFSRQRVFAYSSVISIGLIAFSFWVYKLSGLPERVPSIGLGHERYIAYNERVFNYRKDSFSAGKSVKILVLGNSTGRDLVNVMIESGRFQSDEIVYRNDIDLCDNAYEETPAKLLRAADAVVVSANWTYESKYSRLPLENTLLVGKPVILVGPKHFGYNLNAYIHIPISDRKDVRAALLEDTRTSDRKYSKLVSADHYVDLLKLMNDRFGGVPLFNENGAILSADRVHLTKAGAKFFSEFVFDAAAWAPVLELNSNGALKR